MKHRTFVELITIFLLFHVSTAMATDCPVTTSSDGPYVDGWPQSQGWFGTEKFAIVLPRDGVWPTTKPGHRISVKLFWYVDGFEPGLEREFEAKIRRLDNGPNDAKISRTTNAGGPSLGAWTVLTGIDFPSEGCWEISGNFRGKTLVFVVRTETPAYRRQDAV